MSPRTVRRIVLAVFVGGIAGMIVGSILDNNGVAITFGLITAAAAVGLILVTAVAPAEAFRRADRVQESDRGDQVDRADPGDAAAPSGGPDADAAGARIEEQVELLVAHGADEGEVRELVRRSIAFGRTGRTGRARRR